MPIYYIIQSESNTTLPLNVGIKSCFTKTYDSVSFFNAKCNFQVTAVVSEKYFINGFIPATYFPINGFIPATYYPIQSNFHRKQHNAPYSSFVVVSYEVILC